MSEISRVSLFEKLNPTAYAAVEGATLLCKMRGNPYVELAHWLHHLVQQDGSDVSCILSHFEVESARLAKDLTESLERLPRGATAVSDLSIQVLDTVERAWVYASLMFDAGRVRTGHLIVAWCKVPVLRSALLQISTELRRIKADELCEQYAAITASSSERGEPVERAHAPEGTSAQAEPRPAALGKLEALRRYSADLVQQAREAGGANLVGRDDEIRRCVQVLLRRRQNNPILTGEAGVGKTAVVEGLAQRIAAGDVPKPLRGVSLRALDVGLLSAGASMKGEFEARLRQVIDEVQNCPTPIILFIDEAHTLVGAGGQQGTGDAANLLKPALARGKLRTIAATTWSEYKKYIESDPALTRRFQVVQVAEPGTEAATHMLRSIAAPLESHHRVQILDEALRAAVTLSQRFVPDRQLPDKAVSLLDTACARVAASQHATPPAVESARRELAAFEAEAGVLRREREIGGGDAVRMEQLVQLQREAETAVEQLEERWKSESTLVAGVLEARRELREAAAREHSAGEARESAPPGGDSPERQSALKALSGLQAQLNSLQGESPMISTTVGAAEVAEVVADWTGIPVGRMANSEIETTLGLASELGQRVIGQDHALTMIARRIQTARAGLENPSKPVGVFLLVGPSGVGKTETALSLGDALYGGEQNVITLNMSEFQESHAVSTLKGAPPGYVGHGEGGRLTEAVRRRPYSVVLLDEIEKAHPDVHEIFFQVFDKGWMEDAQGTRVDFRNTVIILTSNVGSEVVMRLCAQQRPSPEAVSEAVRPELIGVFPPALLGRMVTIPYFPLDDSSLGQIVRLQLARVSARVQQRYGTALEYDDSVVQLIIDRCTEVESGGRMIDGILTNSLLPELSRELLVRTMAEDTIARVAVAAEGDGLQYSIE